MKMRVLMGIAFAMALPLAVALGAWADEQEGSEHKDSAHEMPMKAIAVISPTEGNTCRGTVTFTETEEGTLIEANISGLTPGKHGFHIHEYGDISGADGKSTGGHFNPAAMDHSGPESEMRHVGDLGNLVADADGNASYSRVDSTLKVHRILARGITIHAGEDDLTSQPTGAAGGRVGVGVIGVASEE